MLDYVEIVTGEYEVLKDVNGEIVEVKKHVDVIRFKEGLGAPSALSADFIFRTADQNYSLDVNSKEITIGNKSNQSDPFVEAFTLMTTYYPKNLSFNGGQEVYQIARKTSDCWKATKWPIWEKDEIDTINLESADADTVNIPVEIVELIGAENVWGKVYVPKEWNE